MRAFCILVVVVLIVGGGLAYWLHWWRVETIPSKDGGETKVQVTVDKNKVTEDVDVAKNKIEGKAQPSEAIVEGAIRAIDPSNHTLTVMNDKKEEVAVSTDAATRIRVGDKEAKLADLKVGESATVTYESAKGAKVAKNITVKKRS
ncbi:MAG: hypothetical protein ACYC3I_23175 [Gemmataceae bacterium]